MNAAIKQPPVYMSLKDLAASTSKGMTDVIEVNNKKIKVLWYLPPEDAFVALWINENGNIIKQQVNIFGQVCEWNLVNGTRTGIVYESGRKSSVNFDAAIVSTSLQQACEYLSLIADIPEDIKQTLSDNFIGSPTFDSLDPKTLISKYGCSENVLTLLLRKVINFIKFKISK